MKDISNYLRIDNYSTSEMIAENISSEDLFIFFFGKEEAFLKFIILRYHLHGSRYFLRTRHLQKELILNKKSVVQ